MKIQALAKKALSSSNLVHPDEGCMPEQEGLLYFESVLSSLACYVMENVLPNCTFTSGAQELTRISNFCWVTSFHIHRGKIFLKYCSYRFLLQLIYSFIFLQIIVKNLPTEAVTEM